MASRLDRVNTFLDGVRRNRRDIRVPEGVILEVDVANNGERLAAFLLDMMFWGLATLLLFFVLVLLIRQNIDATVATTIILFLSFLLRNFYFIYFEFTTQGSTPGKRIFGLKVIDRLGNPLLPSAIVARNLTREVEIFLPIGFYFDLAAGGQVQGWTSLAYFGWAVLLTAMPFFNKDHLRVGDMVAGTMVVAVPRRHLLSDLIDTRAKFTFQNNQLESYGAFELQVLEELLRKRPSLETSRTRRDVCDRIITKIHYASPIPDASVDNFLRDFYAAQRLHLERDQLFGKLREDKNHPVQRQ